MSHLENEVTNIIERRKRLIHKGGIHQGYVDGLLQQSGLLGINPGNLPFEDRILIGWAHLNARLKNRDYEGIDKQTWVDIVRSRGKVPRRLQFKILEEEGLLRHISSGILQI